MCIYNIKAALFCLEMGFFYQAAPKKIRRATRPTDKIFSRIIFYQAVF
jgi:hypothetical protein